MFNTVYAVLVTSHRGVQRILVRGYKKEDVDVVEKRKELAACHSRGQRERERETLNLTIRLNPALITVHFGLLHRP